MPGPQLPRTTSGDVLVICTYYQDGAPDWGGLLQQIERGALVPDGASVRLRPVADAGWDHLSGGQVPALLPPGGAAAPVAVLVDISGQYGWPLLVDLAAIPGRGVRVKTDLLGEAVTGLCDGTLVFDDLVRAMDARGAYRGDAGRPAFPTPTTPPPRAFPALPAAAYEGATLLVRTWFGDDDGWRALLAELGGIDAEGWVGADLDPDDIDVDDYPLTAMVVDDPGYAGLPPGAVPALLPPEGHTVLVLLADAQTFAGPGRPLVAVDPDDTPGHVAVLPLREAGSMACNLEIANMDFADFVAVAGVRPWWEEA
ncbi:hypothetical protein O7599_16125 [Streptomyces sp. WMMC500]|uniref:DUF6924 domain-containing protein n=1 Tax=Streptomyces sp. WMMC500 TaxID=3015154 RepID=UPI00248C9076|nr:hypothetical protein [Streptomyces sp. WMMC500]WBB63947.1 hypothetical protein O7599_16125 [Streptomyces sp. WMMC500]